MNDRLVATPSCYLRAGLLPGSREVLVVSEVIRNDLSLSACASVSAWRTCSDNCIYQAERAAKSGAKASSNQQANQNTVNQNSEVNKQKTCDTQTLESLYIYRTHVKSSNLHSLKRES